MTRCKHCGFFVDNTLSLGGCYCDTPVNKISNLHEIESIQPISLFTSDLIGVRVLYKNELEVYYPYASCPDFVNLVEYIRTFCHLDRQFKIWYKSGIDKIISHSELVDIMKKDNFEY